MCLYVPFYIIALLSFNYKVQFCAFKGDTQNLPLKRVGRGRSLPLKRVGRGEISPLAVPRG